MPWMGIAEVSAMIPGQNPQEDGADGPKNCPALILNIIPNSALAPFISGSKCECRRHSRPGIRRAEIVFGYSAR
jgi:hypothetical protein